MRKLIDLTGALLVLASVAGALAYTGYVWVMVVGPVVIDRALGWLATVLG